jgi:hypothetical protein
MIYRCAWDAPRNHRAEFALYSHGIAERMPPGILSYHQAVDDWLLIYFHDDALAGGETGAAKVPGGSLVLWKPGAFRTYGRKDDSWTHSWLQVTGTRVAPLLEGLGFKPENPFPAGDPEVVAHGILELHNELTGFQKPSARILGNLFENWLLGLARSRQETGGDRERRLRALKYFLDTHVSAPLTLQEMARRAGMSASHLSALFESAYGESPVAYHILRRIDAAKYLLVHCGMTVSEVAEQTGYADLSSFSRMFKRVAGVSPKRYSQKRS